LFDFHSIQKHVTQLLILLDKNRTIRVQEDYEDDEYDEHGKEIEKRDENGVLGIRGSIVSFVDRLDDEFTKSMQNIDPHTTEYVDRLKDETDLYVLIVRAQQYFESVNYEDSLMRCMLRRVEHLYYKVFFFLFNSRAGKLSCREANVPGFSFLSVALNFIARSGQCPG
jgi:translation initiation factor 3 subunit C